MQVLSHGSTRQEVQMPIQSHMRSFSFQTQVTHGHCIAEHYKSLTSKHQVAKHVRGGHNSEGFGVERLSRLTP
jgi:hypothetical protein